jgi:hypothetical protein
MKKIVIILAAIILSTAMTACDKTPGAELPERTTPIVPTMESSDLPEPESTPETESESEPESETKGDALIELPRDEF